MSKKPKKKLLRLQFPHAGLDRGKAYHGQAPYTTPDCLNVQSEAMVEGRYRGGSRPGLSKSFDDQLGDAGTREIRMLAPLTVVKNDGFTSWMDGFEGISMGGHDERTLHIFHDYHKIRCVFLHHRFVYSIYLNYLKLSICCQS